jgi:hypothetical protein
MLVFISGLTTMGYVLAGLFFFRFWRRTGDRLFAYFGVSFWLLAVGQALNALSGISSDDQSWIYLLRLAAFTLLIVGIIGKNMGEAGRRPDAGTR